jgi:hypothetical protein
MRRYLIIDLSLVEKGQMSEVRLEQLKNDVESGDGIILTEEETLDKFKEAFDAGANWMYSEHEIDDWNEFKKEL